MTTRQGREQTRHRSRYLGSRAATGPNGWEESFGAGLSEGDRHAVIGIFFTGANTKSASSWNKTVSGSLPTSVISKEFDPP